jgi:hypothetical protein
MGQVHHGSATTTAAIRQAIQHSQASSLRAVAKRYGINQKTVAKWKRHTSVADPRRHPVPIHSKGQEALEDAAGPAVTPFVKLIVSTLAH